MNLQIALIALGIIVIMAIYFFSRWQSERTTKAPPSNRTVEPQLASQEKDEPNFDLAAAIDQDVDAEAGEITDSQENEIPVFEQRADALRLESIDSELTHLDDEEDDSQNFRLIIPEEGLHSELAAPIDAASIDAEPIDAESVDEILGKAFDSQEAPLSEFEERTENIPPVNPPTLDTSGIAEEIAEEIEYEEENILNEPVFTIEPVSEDLATDIDSEWSQNINLNKELEINQDDVPILEVESIASTHEEIESDLVNDIDPELEQQRPSLRNFLGSIKPSKATEALGKLKGDLQTRLESVKADRNDTFQGYTDVVEDPVEVTEPPILETPIEPQVEASVLDMQISELDTPPELIIDPMSSSVFDGQSELGQTADASVAIPLAEINPTTVLDQENSPEPSRISELSPAEGFDKLSQLDYYVKLNGDRDVSRESVLAIYRESASQLSKGHSIYGLRMPDKVWRDLENEPEESRFGDIVITVQLVDQRGPVSEQDMSQFSNLVMNLSETTGRGFSFMAPIENAIQQAHAIDQFRKQFDSIFVVNIKPTESEFFEGPIIDRCAKQIGLTPDENNFYTRYKPIGKEQKVTLYSLANMSDTGEFDLDNMRAVRTRGVTVFTRPAVNRSPGAVFAEMVDAAKALASRIKGEVIAPGYDDLSTDDAEAIRRSIETVAEEMESYGITPGSEEAIRLF